MAEPTDADRQRAREIARQFHITVTPENARVLTIGLVLDEATDIIAAAIAAARAEALEQAAQVPDRLRSDWGGYDGDDACVACAAAIRAIKEPGHGK